MTSSDCNKMIQRVQLRVNFMKPIGKFLIGNQVPIIHKRSIFQRMAASHINEEIGYYHLAWMMRVDTSNLILQGLSEQSVCSGLQVAVERLCTPWLKDMKISSVRNCVRSFTNDNSLISCRYAGNMLDLDSAIKLSYLIRAWRCWHATRLLLSQFWTPVEFHAWRCQKSLRKQLSGGTFSS